MKTRLESSGKQDHHLKYGGNVPFLLRRERLNQTGYGVLEQLAVILCKRKVAVCD